MASIDITRVPFRTDTLRAVADDLLARLPGAAHGDLSAALVLLPSARACRSLGHVLLEASGADTLLLPRIQTVAQWAGEQEAALGLVAGGLAIISGLGTASDPGPDDRTRPLILAPHLAALPWLADNPESAPGLARELIQFFDEARLHGQADLLLDPDRLGELEALAGEAQADILAGDMARVHEGWAVYRRLVPRDSTDRLRELGAATTDRPVVPLVPPELVVVAAFGRVDPTRAALLRAALAQGRAGRLFLPAVDGPLASFFAATWGASQAGTDPLAPARRCEELVAGTPPAVAPDSPILRERLDALAAGCDPQDLLAPRGPLEFLPCGSAEAEAAAIADRVARLLQEAAATPAGALPRITVATNDPKLADRIRAQLWDAGIDADDTHGDPLSALPAGLLLRFLLRAALTDLRIEPLLEVLTHPYVQLPVGEGHHAKWTLRLEQMYRRDNGPRGGLAALHRRADERDEAVLNLIRRTAAEAGEGMVDFVTHIADAFAPLLPFGDGKPHPWSALLAGVRRSWGLLAPGRALGEGDKSRADLARLDELLTMLERDADRLPPATLAEFNSELGRLLGAENAAAHRQPNLPVVIAGLVEARLERSDVLILAGLRDGVFPKRSARPLFLAGSLRERLGLPGWTAALARDAELFTRLLHGAPQVLLTWATDEGGQKALPSSFVTRLELALSPAAEAAATPAQWRTRPVPWQQIAAAERQFSADGLTMRAQVPIRPLTQLSWSALSMWRDCPYRFVLSRGFALRREEEVQEEFRQMDYGNLVHSVLQEWLTPDGAGCAALVAGDAATAANLLDDAAHRAFDRGADELPQRRLWFANFRGGIPGLVRNELGRCADWHPTALERKFTVALPAMREWAAELATSLGAETTVPDLPAHALVVELTGSVDRVDRHRDGTGSVAIIDYKTGGVPSVKQVAELEELQVLLYAAAAEMGALALDGPPAGVREAFYYAVKPNLVGGPATPHLTDDEAGRRLLLDGTIRLIELSVAASDPQAEYRLLPRELDGTGPTNLPCRYCDFRGACRIEERPVPAATARKLDKLINRKD